MPALVRVSAWSGLLLLCSLAGCASMEPMSWRLPIGGPGPEPVEFLAEALAASPPAREAMWQSLRAADPGVDQKLRMALMQSVPEHSGYNRGAAQKRLRKLLSGQLSPGQRAVAQVRLNELDSASQCQVEVQSLRQRMAAVVEIERRLNGGR
jgi:hypothetical protein